MDIDHVVLWVADPKRSAEFYGEVVGLAPERVSEFLEGKFPFPSVRVSAGSIIDLMPLGFAERIRKSAQMERRVGGGEPLNHLCLVMTAGELDALHARLEKAGVPVRFQEHLLGARGEAARAFYFQDPDDNLLEARHY